MPLYTVTPQFPWSHTYTDNDLVEWGIDSLMCPFATAMRDAMRPLFYDVFEADFYRLQAMFDYFVSGPHVVNDETYSRLTPLREQPGGALVNGELNAPYTGVPTEQFDGGLYQPAVFRLLGWLQAHHPTNVGTPFETAPNPLQFTWGLLQRMIEVLSFYYVDPALDLDGYDFAATKAAAVVFADKYFPTSTGQSGDTSNPRENFRRLGHFNPPVIGLGMPECFGQGGWTRKREREITSLSAPGEEGQRARFVVCDSLTQPFPFGGGYDFGSVDRYGEFVDGAYVSHGASGIGVLGHNPPPLGSGTPSANVTPSAYPSEPWVIDPKPIVRDVQVPSQPDTPDEDRSNSLKFCDYRDGEWVVSEDQNEKTSPADEITLRGLMRRGDLVGPWLLNEMRDALNRNHVTVTGATVIADYNEDRTSYVTRIAVPMPAAPSYPQRFVGGAGLPWGPRSAKFYGFKDNAAGDGFTPLEYVGESSVTSECMLKSGPMPSNMSDYRGFYARIDWSPSLNYKTGGNPPTCPPAWSSTRICPDDDGPDTGTGNGTNPGGGTGTSPGTGSGTGGIGTGTGTGTGGGTGGGGTGGGTGTGSGTGTNAGTGGTGGTGGGTDPSGGTNPGGGTNGGGTGGGGTGTGSGTGSDYDCETCGPCCVSSDTAYSVSFTKTSDSRVSPDATHDAYVQAANTQLTWTEDTYTDPDTGETTTYRYLAGEFAEGSIQNGNTTYHFKFRLVAACGQYSALEYTLEGYTYASPAESGYPEYPNMPDYCFNGAIDAGSTCKTAKRDFFIGNAPSDGVGGKLTQTQNGGQPCCRSGGGCVKGASAGTSEDCNAA